MKSIDVRQLWKQFWQDKAPEMRKHTWVAPAHLIVNNAEDPTTMFNTAGMQQFVPYLMGKTHPLGDRLYNIQGCVRTTDINEVGDVSHLTFFEMMGNRSLGDYFKKEAIAWSWEFLTSKEYLGLDPINLAVSVFEGDNDAPRDEKSAIFWEESGVPRERIAYLGKSENRRGPAGTSGPCGPDTEIFYWIGSGPAPTVFDPVGDEDNRLEIWNNVFMAYYKDNKGSFTELENKNVDTGMGFERICMVMQGVELLADGVIDKLGDVSVYHIDIFQDILLTMQAYMNHQYPSPLVTDLDMILAHSYRIVADHLRTAIFLIDEGLTPSNEGRGYVLRRIVRRGYYHLMKIHPEGEDWISDGTLLELLGEILTVLVKHYIHLVPNKQQTLSILFEEMKQFQSTLDKGSKKFSEMLKKQTGKIFSGEDAFILYDTYGVPVELTQELVVQCELTVDMSGFKKAMQTAQEKSRVGSKKMFTKDIDRAQYIEGLTPTLFVGYDRLEDEEIKLLKEFEVGGQKILIFDRTPFYAESGGQVADKGFVELDSGAILHVVDVQKYGGVYLHFIA